MGTVLYDPYREALEAATGLDLDAAHRVKDGESWPDFERGVIDEATFEARFFADGERDRPFDVDAFHRVRRDGYAFLPGMQDLLERASRATEVVIASNYPVWIDELRERFDLDRHCAHVVVSHELGVRKPDPAFFVHLLGRIGHAGERCLFVDDREDNCAAARAAGLRAHRFVDAVDLEQRLVAEGILDPAHRRAASTPSLARVRTHRLATIGGDGIGPEVTAQALKAVRAAGDRFGFDVDVTPYDLGGERYVRTGEVLPPAVLEELRGVDAILLGAVGTPSVPPGVLERGLLLALRFAFDLYVNLRPVKLLPGVTSPVAGLTPERCDLVVVRENTEGLYAGAGGVLYRGTAAEVATQESLNTRRGVERVVRHAFARAERRRGHLTLCHKTNVLTFAGDLWQRTVDEVAGDFPDVEVAYVHVDAACLYLVTSPERFDVVVTDNLFGDILTDLGAAVQGGLGLAASGNLDPTRAAPSMFEPVHGSAPDIAGTGTANPVAAVLSAAMCLEHLGEADAARALEDAVGAVLPALEGHELQGVQGAGTTTDAIGDRIAEHVAAGAP